MKGLYRLITFDILENLAKKTKRTWMDRQKIQRHKNVGSDWLHQTFATTEFRKKDKKKPWHPKG